MRVLVKFSLHHCQPHRRGSKNAEQVPSEEITASKMAQALLDDCKHHPDRSRGLSALPKPSSTAAKLHCVTRAATTRDALPKFGTI